MFISLFKDETRIIMLGGKQCLFSFFNQLIYSRLLSWQKQSKWNTWRKVCHWRVGLQLICNVTALRNQTFKKEIIYLLRITLLIHFPFFIISENFAFSTAVPTYFRQTQNFYHLFRSKLKQMIHIHIQNHRTFTKIYFISRKVVSVLRQRKFLLFTNYYCSTYEMHWCERFECNTHLKCWCKVSERCVEVEIIRFINHWTETEWSCQQKLNSENVVRTFQECLNCSIPWNPWLKKRITKESCRILEIWHVKQYENATISSWVILAICWAIIMAFVVLTFNIVKNEFLYCSRTSK